MSDSAISAPPDAKTGVAESADVVRPFRRLKAAELRQGDFVLDERCGFGPWEGPDGFRAGSFMKSIYQKQIYGTILNILKQIGLALVQLTKQVCALPQALANLGKQRRLKTVLDEREAERLDRIRNPDKYRGK